MNIKKFNKIQLNYRELDFVSDKYSARECKSIYEEILDSDVTLKTEIEANKLTHLFKPVRSIDKRYDGVNYLILKLALMGSGYKKFLKEKSVLKAKKFTGGKSIFYKLLNEIQLSHVQKVLG